MVSFEFPHVSRRLCFRFNNCIRRIDMVMNKRVDNALNGQPDRENPTEEPTAQRRVRRGLASKMYSSPFSQYDFFKACLKVLQTF